LSRTTVKVSHVAPGEHMVPGPFHIIVTFSTLISRPNEGFQTIDFSFMYLLAPCYVLLMWVLNKGTPFASPIEFIEHLQHSPNERLSFHLLCITSSAKSS
jgi:hypothetical protein